MMTIGRGYDEAEIGEKFGEDKERLGRGEEG